MRLNLDKFNELSTKQKVLTCCIGAFIIIILIGIVVPDNNNSSTDNDTLKPSTYINVSMMDMGKPGLNGHYEMRILSDNTSLCGECYNNNPNGEQYWFSEEQMKILAYNSNYTFNYTKLGLTYHDVDGYHVVDHIFFENGTEMTDSGNITLEQVASRGLETKVGNSRMAESFGLNDDDALNV